MSPAAERESTVDVSLHTLSYGQYQLGYEVYGSGDRVLVWLHGLLLDASLDRRLAKALARPGQPVGLDYSICPGLGLAAAVFRAEIIAE